MCALILVLLASGLFSSKEISSASQSRAVEAFVFVIFGISAACILAAVLLELCVGVQLGYRIHKFKKQFGRVRVVMCGFVLGGVVVFVSKCRVLVPVVLKHLILCVISRVYVASSRRDGFVITPAQCC